jgi:citrate lyase beta subunit
MTSPLERPLGPVWLFAPAHAARKALGALASEADQVVLDLEDSVPAGEKDAARAALLELARAPRRGSVFVRVNGIGTPHCLRDIEAAVAAAADGIMLPKAETAEDVAIASWALSQTETTLRRERPTALIPLIETACGVVRMGTIRWGVRTPCVAFGSVDYEADLALTSAAGQSVVQHARHAIVLASRATGLGPPIDGVTVAARDTAQCLEDAAAARGMGFGGKLAIHPAQIAPIQAAFRPSADELDWAADVIRSMATAPESGAILVRGRLVDAPVVLQAERLLARGGAAER